MRINGCVDVVDVAQARNISINDSKTVETIITMQASLIHNSPTLKALKHVESKKLIKEINRLDKVLLNAEIKYITELTAVL